jgi:aryl-alcohol dehydrogenase-like predicted oxidoreductase
MAFALLDPSVTTVLFGATRPEQVSANLGALALADRLTPEERDRLAAIGVRRLPAGPAARRLGVCPASKHASLTPTTPS